MIVPTVVSVDLRPISTTLRASGLEHGQRADEMVGHQLDRGADRFRGVDSDDAGLLPFEQLPDGTHREPPGAAFPRILRPQTREARARGKKGSVPFFFARFL
jgi:hypothetical protein